MLVCEQCLILLLRRYNSYITNMFNIDNKIAAYISSCSLLDYLLILSAAFYNIYKNKHKIFARVRKIIQS